MKKFAICRHCGNIIEMVHDAKVPVFCCGQKMEVLVPNTVEASGEKHVPVASVEGSKVIVNVGSVDHPMVPEHFIEWVYVETDKGGYRKELRPDSAPHVEFELGEDKPVAVYAYCNLHGPDSAPHVEFELGDDKPVAVYAYCNLHGLWKTEL